MEEFIKKIIKQTKNELLKNIESEYYEELLKQYEQHLNMQFRGLEIKNKYYNEALEKEITLNNSILSKMDKLEKLSFFLPDKAYEKLATLSNRGIELGIKRYNENIYIDEKEAKKNRKKMEEHLKNVREFNKMKANVLYSDGVLDYDYACGNSDIFSLKLGHLIPKT